MKKKTANDILRKLQKKKTKEQKRQDKIQGSTDDMETKLDKLLMKKSK